MDIQKQLIDARTKLGLLFLDMNYMNNAKEAIEPIIDLALNIKNEKRISQIFSILGTWHWFVKEDFQTSYAYLTKALNISKKSQDPHSFAVANAWLGQVVSVNCEFKKASNHLEEALAFQVQANNKAWISTLKSTLSFFGYYYPGKIHLAYETSLGAIGIADEFGDIYPKANAYICHGISCYGKGRLKEAQDYLLKGIYLKEKMKSYIYGVIIYNGLGDTYYQTGNYQGAIKQYEKAIRFMENTIMYRSWLNWSKIALARAQVMNEEQDVDINELSGFVSENRVKVHEGRMRKYIAEILVNLEGNHLNSAESWIHEAIEADRKNGMKFYLGRDYVLSAEINQRKGDPIKAKEDINNAIDIFKECGADGWVVKYEKELGSY